MEPKTKETEFEEIPISVSESPTSLTDVVQVAERKDNSFLLRFISMTPDMLFENHRTVICKEEIIVLIDGLCKILNHYPKRPLPRKKRLKKLK